MTDSAQSMKVDMKTGLKNNSDKNELNTSELFECKLTLLTYLIPLSVNKTERKKICKRNARRLLGASSLFTRKCIKSVLRHNVSKTDSKFLKQYDAHSCT